MKHGKLQLSHKESGQPLYEREINLIGEKGDRAASEYASEDGEQINVDPIDAQLQIEEKDFEELHSKVIDKVKSFINNKYSHKWKDSLTL